MRPPRRSAVMASVPPRGGVADRRAPCRGRGLRCAGRGRHGGLPRGARAAHAFMLSRAELRGTGGDSGCCGWGDRTALAARACGSALLRAGRACPLKGHWGDWAGPGVRLVGPAVGGDRDYGWVSASVRQAVVHYTGSDPCPRPMPPTHHLASCLAVIQHLSLGDPHCLSLRRFGSSISGSDPVPQRKLPWLGAVPAASCASHS